MTHKLILYNTLNKKREIFIPLDDNQIKLYVCGPTVYDHPHIGNARSLVIYDILYRLLIEIYGRIKVTYVRNITDIDDKIIIRARDLNIPISELTSNITQEFHNITKYLNCLEPNIEPKATEHIYEMQMIIQKLLDNDFAYQVNGNVYFNVEKFADYHKLSNRNFIETIEGVRTSLDPDKKNEKDFILWKFKDETSEHHSNYSSPWGVGRPGWHIECSAMSYKYLGENFDIHGGGADLIFPHHTNEIAQSRCAFTNSNFANYWVHNGFLTVKGEKMSKSLGNFITVKDLVTQEIPGEVIRLFLLSGNYRHPIDFNDKSLSDSHKMLDYWYRSLEKRVVNTTNMTLDNDFINSLLDDMNTPIAIKIINDYAKKLHYAATNNANETNEQKFELELNQIASQMVVCANFIGLLKNNVENWFLNKNSTEAVNNAEIHKLIELRKIAKENKDYLQADSIRKILTEKGIIIEDRPDGTYFIRYI